MILTTSYYEISNPNPSKIRVSINASRCSKKRYCITYTDDIVVYKLECFGTKDEAEDIKNKILSAIEDNRDLNLNK